MNHAMDDREFRLITDAIRLVFASAAKPTFNSVGPDFDFERFLSLCRRHRVEGLVWDGLRHSDLIVPDRSAEVLARKHDQIVAHNLRVCAESAVLLAEFRSASIEPLFVKGATLGAIAYRRPLSKMGWDIDLLVHSDEISAASDILRRLDYRPVDPPGDPDRTAIAAWHRTRKESLWRKRHSDMHVDLHSRLVDNELLWPKMSEAGVQKVKVANGIELPTLTDADLYRYLCVHGAWASWFRLKWLADLAGFLASQTKEQIAELHITAMQAGAGRASAQALILAHDFFHINVGSDLLQRLTADRTTRLLVTVARFHLTGPLSLREPTETPFGTLLIHLAEPLLQAGWRFKVNEVRRQLVEFFA
jgi:hypothetical protein